MAKYGAALRPDALSRSPVRALEQEPSAAFGLVDPRLDHARAGDVAIFVAQSVDLPHTGGKLEIVVTELSQHVERSDVVGIIIQTRWRREICPMERIVVPRPCVPVRLSHLTSQVSRGNQFHRIRGQIGRCPERRRPAHLRVLQCHLCHSLQSIDLFIGGSALPTMKVAYTSSFQYSLTSYLRTSSTQVVWSPCRGMSRL